MLRIDWYKIVIREFPWQQMINLIMKDYRINKMMKSLIILRKLFQTISRKQLQIDKGILR